MWQYIVMVRTCKSILFSSVSKGAVFFSETLDTALGCGFSISDDYLQLWQCYCDYVRRQVDDWSEGMWVFSPHLFPFFCHMPLAYMV